MDVIKYYEQALAEHGYQADATQRAAIERLQQYDCQWRAFKAARSNTFKRLFVRPEVPRGVYLWGGVGRGKSFLMDAFYAATPIKRKARLHFHEFMRGVHRQLEAVKGMADPLDEVAKRVAKKYRMICFDEFHVSDVADAMILYRLLDALFRRGVSFVMTSNYEPSTLYPDGLNRERMLAAIALIKQKMDVLNVDAGVDYRRRALEQVELYHYPLDADAQQAMMQAFARFANGMSVSDPVLRIEHRDIRPVRLAGDVVWFDFATLCGGPRSQNDYLALAGRFTTVMLSDVPRLSARQASQARRFTWLIDVLYDHRVKLIMSADCPPAALYTQGPMAHEFHRTVSRILEMQSKDYLEAPRREAATL